MGEHQTSSGSTAAPEDWNGRQDAPRGRVLILDDEPSICRVVARSLQRSGFATQSIDDPERVLELLKDATEYDIVLLDRSMGAGDGQDIVTQLRSQSPHAKILYFTGESLSPHELGLVDGFVAKPINGKQLAETLLQFL